MRGGRERGSGRRKEGPRGMRREGREGGGGGVKERRVREGGGSGEWGEEGGGQKRIDSVGSWKERRKE